VIKHILYMYTYWFYYTSFNRWELLFILNCENIEILSLINMHKEDFKFLKQSRFWARYTSFLRPRVQISVIWTASDIRYLVEGTFRSCVVDMLYYAPAEEWTNEGFQCFSWQNTTIIIRYKQVCRIYNRLF
jgi:hypothetical protein